MLTKPDLMILERSPSQENFCPLGAPSSLSVLYLTPVQTGILKTVLRPLNISLSSSDKRTPSTVILIAETPTIGVA
jgi:hypothetical protein